MTFGGEGFVGVRGFVVVVWLFLGWLEFVGCLWVVVRWRNLDIEVMEIVGKLWFNICVI